MAQSEPSLLVSVTLVDFERVRAELAGRLAGL